MSRTVKYLDENFNLKSNHLYYTQIQISMAVTNVKCCDFVLYSEFDNKYHITTVYWNLDTVTNITNKLRSVYFVKLLPKIFEKHN